MVKYVMFLLLFLPALCCQQAFGKHKLTIGGINLEEFREGDSDPYGDFKTLSIPIKRAGNLLLVDAQVDTLSGNFVLDTGAPYLVLNSTYFRNAPKYGDQEAGGVNGRSEGTFTTMIHNFSLGFDLHYDRLIADVTDLSGIENSKHVRILGLLGTRVFAKLAITIDLANNLLYIHKLDKNGDIKPDDRVFSNPDMKADFKLMNEVIFLKTAVNDRPMWFAFDTGAETNMLDLHAPRKIIKSMEIINRSKLTGVGGSSYELVYARFDKLVIGNYEFKTNRILISNLENIGKAYGYSVEGILGYDFFTRGAFTINFVKKEFEMYIYKQQ